MRDSNPTGETKDFGVRKFCSNACECLFSMLGGWGEIEAGMRGCGYWDLFVISQKKLLLSVKTNSGKLGAPIKEKRLKKLDPDISQMINDEIRLGFDNFRTEPLEQFTNDYIAKQLRVGCEYSLSVLKDKLDLLIQYDDPTLYDYSIIAFRTNSLSRIVDVRTVDSFVEGDDDINENVVDELRDVQRPVIDPVCATEMCDDAIESSSSSTSNFVDLEIPIVSILEANLADIASPGLFVIDDPIINGCEDEDLGLSAIRDELMLEDILEEIDIIQNNGMNTESQKFERPSKWHVQSADSGVFYDVRTVIAMLNRHYTTGMEKDRLRKIIQSCKTAENCPEYRQLNKESDGNIKQWIAPHTTVAFLYDDKISDDVTKKVEIVKTFYIGEVLKMVTSSGVLWKERVALDSVPPHLKIHCRWFKRVEGINTGSSAITETLYQFGPSIENNTFIYGKFAICQVKLVKISSTDLSINAVYTLDATDRSVCDKFVREAQLIDDLRVEVPEFQPALPSVTDLVEIQQPENVNVTDNKKRPFSLRPGGAGTVGKKQTTAKVTKK